MAPSKYHHHSANANAMLVNAVEAAATLQVFWLSMPRITDATNSPRRMMVKRPKRSGKWAASGGKFTLCFAASQGTVKSTISAVVHSQYRCGTGARAEGDPDGCRKPEADGVADGQLAWLRDAAGAQIL